MNTYDFSMAHRIAMAAERCEEILTFMYDYNCELELDSEIKEKVRDTLTEFMEYLTYTKLPKYC